MGARLILAFKHECTRIEATVIEIRRSALVRHSPEQMFDLVDGVEAYPKRFPWCSASAVVERSDNVLVARLDLHFMGLRHSFTTRNTAERPHRIDIHLVDGPFRSLDGHWSFTALGDDGCKVALALDFEYAGIGGSVLKLGFQGLANRMVDDFCVAADHLHG
nr:type II toxin-antitoxin system RatA family toxin [Rhodanobacter sp. 7MK24]